MSSSVNWVVTSHLTTVGTTPASDKNISQTFPISVTVTHAPSLGRLLRVRGGGGDEDDVGGDEDDVGGDGGSSARVLDCPPSTDKDCQPLDEIFRKQEIKRRKRGGGEAGAKTGVWRGKGGIKVYIARSPAAGSRHDTVDSW